MLLIFCLLPSAQAASPENSSPDFPSLEITRAEAVRSDWNAQTPPESGWVPVELVDFWTARWPRHDGVVWYRLHWQQKEAGGSVGLLVNYVCMASAIYVNGSLIARNEKLVEPLSRAWIRPQYFLLSAPLLKAGENTLLVRVSGLSTYQPGFGTVVVGDPAEVHAQYERGVFNRIHIKLINVAISAVLGSIFLLLWLLRRQDSVYGWFALTELASSFYNYNFLASSPWPFSSTDAWQAFNTVAYMAAATTYAIFMLRFGERRMPRLEKLMGLLCLMTLLVAIMAPQFMGVQRNYWYLTGSVFYYASIGWFLLLAWRVPRADYRVLAVCLLIQVLVSFHDLALFLGLVRSDTYVLALTSVFTLIGIAFALAWRFVGAMRKVESFNAELQREVDSATQQLSATLAREHELALANSRAGERLQLTRDLHDGFGGTLVGAIARLELAPEDVPKAQMVGLLKEMRDDLRLVIDSTTREGVDLPHMLAPLRSRTGKLLEAVEIDSYWHLADIDGLELDSMRSLDLLRFLQEALTNVFKHSRAGRVDVHVLRHGDELQVRVHDDGVGLPAELASADGAGFGSMRMRAQRLHGKLEVGTPARGTELLLVFPVNS
ncbi:MAG: 7TM diverse intracellular signaling domain-containing protein [Pedobacter sp.]|nr:7TM diverse intracellular signaling domain-containing protein [Pedobacter sp.]